MTGQHRKPGATVYFDANLPAVRKYIDDAVAGAVNQAAESIRAVREWCDKTEADTRAWLEKHNPECECEVGETYLNAVDQVRALLPPVPPSAGEVDMDGTRVTRDDREYPGGTDSGN